MIVASKASVVFHFTFIDLYSHKSNKVASKKSLAIFICKGRLLFKWPKVRKMSKKLTSSTSKTALN